MYVLPVAAKIDSTRTRLASVRYEIQAKTESRSDVQINLSTLLSFTVAGNRSCMQ
jgi:hypothetical protein